MELTQKELAAALGYSQAQISRVMSGTTLPSVKLAKLLEPYLGKPWQSWFESKRPSTYSPQKQDAD